MFKKCLILSLFFLYFEEGLLELWEKLKTFLTYNKFYEFQD